MWRFLKKLKIELPYDPAIPTLGIYLKKNEIPKDAGTPMFIAALFTINRIQKQPKCPSTEEWINKIWSIYTMDYCVLSRFGCVQLCDPVNYSPPGSSVHGILQARTLEWVAIFFSNAWKWKVKAKLLSRVQLFATPWTAAYQPPPSMGFSRQKYWSGVPLPFFP